MLQRQLFPANVVFMYSPFLFLSSVRFSSFFSVSSAIPSFFYLSSRMIPFPLIFLLVSSYSWILVCFRFLFRPLFYSLLPPTFHISYRAFLSSFFPGMSILLMITTNGSLRDHLWSLSLPSHYFDLSELWSQSGTSQASTSVDQTPNRKSEKWNVYTNGSYLATIYITKSTRPPSTLRGAFLLRRSTSNRRPRQQRMFERARYR